MAKTSNRIQLIMRLDDVIQQANEIFNKFSEQRAYELGKLKKNTAKYKEQAEDLKEMSARVIKGLSDLKFARLLLNCSESDLGTSLEYVEKINEKIDYLENEIRKDSAVKDSSYMNIASDILELIKCISEQKSKGQEIIELMEVEREINKKKQDIEQERSEKLAKTNKRFSGWFIASMVLLMILCLVSFLITLLDSFNVIDLNGYRDKLSAIIGASDLVLGVLAFAIERISDRNKKGVERDAEKEKYDIDIKSVKVEINNGIRAAKGIVFEGDVQQAFDAVASVINTGNKSTENETKEVLEQKIKEADNINYYVNNGMDSGGTIKIKTEVKKKKIK